jgi:hypothetical protein
MMKRFDTLVPGDFLARSECVVTTAPVFVKNMRVGMGETLPMWECMVRGENGWDLPFSSTPDREVEVSHNIGVQQELF